MKHAEKDRIASIVYTDCTLIPGANFYNAAMFAIDAMEARSKQLNEAAQDLLNVAEHAIQWLHGDKWRFDEDPTKRESWEIMMRALKNAVAKARGES